jgi:2-hydroxy-3-keto-5-methylthiopentenyl-1-phosphate phosphatase
LQQSQKILVQCDFDGTVTVEDVSFMLLDAFADGDWRQWEEEYEAGRMSIGNFNSKVFGMVRVDRQTMLDYIRDRVVVRPGFVEFVALCRQRGFRLVIVSNGLRFYIEQVLGDMGIADIEVHAARTRFCPDGLRVEYVGPDGAVLGSGFKESFTRLFLADGNRVVYIGDGRSDFIPAGMCHQVFATVDNSSLLTRCRKGNVDCHPFADFHDVVGAIDSR